MAKSEATNRSKGAKAKAAPAKGKKQIPSAGSRGNKDLVVPRDRHRYEVKTFKASEAKSNLGEVMDAARRQPVFITRYNRAESVVISIGKYRQLEQLEQQAKGAGPDLDELTKEFDAMVERMRTPEAAAGAEAFFAMGSEALGQAAARGARRRKK